MLRSAFRSLTETARKDELHMRSACYLLSHQINTYTSGIDNESGKEIKVSVWYKFMTLM